MLLTVAAIMLLQAATLPSPIAEASQGRLQCFSPDRTAKTCASLAAYRIAADGSISNAAIVMVSASPAIAMATDTKVVVKAGQVCGVIRAKDIDDARIFVSGQRLDDNQSAGARTAIKSMFAAMFDKEICTSFATGPDALAAQAEVDGVKQPGADQPVIWVSATDGYSVAGRTEF